MRFTRAALVLCALAVAVRRGQGLGCDALAFTAGADAPPAELRGVAGVDALARLLSTCAPRLASDPLVLAPSTSHARECVVSATDGP